MKDKQTLTAVFAGTPDFAVPSLRRLDAHPQVEIIAVYTQPDRPAGRGRRARSSAVKQTATELSIPVYQPASLKTEEEISAWCALGADLLVVAAYGLLVPREVIDQPLLAANVHASLLPRWRGAAPIQRAIMAGDEETGISIMRVVEALDAGPVLLQRSFAIGEEDTGGSVHDGLAALGAECLAMAVDDLVAGRLVETPQDEARVVYASKITGKDRILDWSQGAHELARRVRALNPVPVATMSIGNINVKVWSAIPLSGAATRVEAGTIVAAGEVGIDVATRDGLLRVTRLQPQGKRAMSAAEFVNGFGHLLPAAL